ncbi:MAG TPA: MFS transporter [candidate division Zixibacteria bacterium]|nr:MFS transporter [candidate division Zixibacteria bacterium]
MKLPFFYGWVIVAIAMIAGFFSAGVSNITMAVVLKPISEDLGWSRSLTAAAVTLGALLGGGLSPFFGPVADRLGPRLLLPAGGLVVGLLAFGVSLSTEPWQFYAAFIPARALTEFLLCGIVPYTAVANWFYRRRPRAMGLVAMSVPLGSSVLSLVYQFFVAHYGWRGAFAALGFSLWFLVALPGAILLRRQPEDLGLGPDGAPPGATEDAAPRGSGQPAAAAEHSWSRAEAMRTAALWLVVAGTFLASLATGGIAFHAVAYFTDAGVAPATAAGALSVMALSGAFGNAVWGVVAEKFEPPRLNVATMLLSAGTVALLAQVKGGAAAYLFGVSFGLAARGAAVLTPILLARYFGRRSYGAISSVLEPFHKGGLGLGALFAGMAFDLTGDYRLIIWIFLASYLLSALLISLARRPVPRAHRA